MYAAAARCLLLGAPQRIVVDGKHPAVVNNSDYFNQLDPGLDSDHYEDSWCVHGFQMLHSLHCIPPQMCVCMFAECGNQQCDYGEQCTNVACTGGCAVDCPPFLGTCPIGLQIGSSGNATVCSSAGACKQGTGQCSCYTGYTGTACDDCELDYLCVFTHGPCIFLPGTTATCDDGVKDGNEVGVDCGGPNCHACEPPALLSPLLKGVIGACAFVVLVGVALWAWRRCRRGRGDDDKPRASIVSVVPEAPAGTGSARPPRHSLKDRTDPVVKAVAQAQGQKASMTKRKSYEAVLPDPGVSHSTENDPMRRTSVNWGASRRGWLDGDGGGRVRTPAEAPPTTVRANGSAPLTLQPASAEDVRDVEDYGTTVIRSKWMATQPVSRFL